MTILTCLKAAAALAFVVAVGMPAQAQQKAGKTRQIQIEKRDEAPKVEQSQPDQGDAQAQGGVAEQAKEPADVVEKAPVEKAPPGKVVKAPPEGDPKVVKVAPEGEPVVVKKKVVVVKQKPRRYYEPDYYDYGPPRRYYGGYGYQPDYGYRPSYGYGYRGYGGY